MRRAAGYSAGDDLPTPRLPGHSVANVPAEKPRPLPQIFRYVNGIPVMKEQVRVEPNIAIQNTTEDVGSKVYHTSALEHPFEGAASLPSWLAHDRQVLRFYAYLKEVVPDNLSEPWRVRRCVVAYYLEDDTIQITEPVEDNSGLPQGTFLRRHRVTNPDGTEVRWQQLQVGSSITFYSRTFTIIACDAWTRQWLSARGQQVPADQEYPVGPYDMKLHAKDKHGNRDQSARPGTLFEYHMMRSKFLENDRKVLRFYACWDDTSSLFGDKLPFVLHYFLADDTIEVREVHLRNDGRDPYPLLLRRMRLSKITPDVGARPPSPQARAELQQHCYHWRELRIGFVVKVYGRDMLIIDCDDFTRTWYKQRLNLQDRDLAPIKVEYDNSPKAPPITIPPDTLGIGRDEDSRQNVLHLVPKALARDYNQYLENEGKVLRFAAAMVPPEGRGLVSPHDKGRRFVVTFHLADGKLSIYEPPKANSGIAGGMFLDKTQVRDPKTQRPYSGRDLYIGAVLPIYSRAFELLDADDHTLAFMEQQPNNYPMASFDQVIRKVRSQIQQRHGAADALRTQLIKGDSYGSGMVTRAAVKAALTAVGVSVSMHEVVTLMRRLHANSEAVPAADLLRLLTS